MVAAKTQKFTVLHLCAAVLMMTTTLATAEESDNVATAVFGASGVTGWIRFFEYYDHIAVVVNMVGFASNASWSIHQLPVDLTLSPSDKCSEDYLGPVYDPFDFYNATLCSEEEPVYCAGDLGERYGPIDDTPQLFNDTTLLFNLKGPHSIVGRSIIVEHSGGVLCATIRSNVEKELTQDKIVTLKATFTSPLAGSIYFRQAREQSTTIFGKLFWVNGNEMSFDHNWAIFSERVTEDYRQGNCSTVASRYDPLSAGPTSHPEYDEDYGVGSTDGFEVGDLSGKHSPIHIDDTPAPYSELAFLFTDSNLTLTGFSGIEGLTLAIYNAESGSDIVACAPIIRSEVIETVQYPDVYFSANQASPYENSTIEFDSNLPMGDHSILGTALMADTPCPADEEPFDPFNVGSNDTLSPTVKRTPDQYPLGDLTKKYDYLVSPSTTLNVPDLPLYGRNTVLGRTFRTVIKSPDAPTKRICSALVPLNDEQVIIAKASLNQNITGVIYFVQNQNPQLSGQQGLTSIVTNIYNSDPETVAETNNDHIWLLSDSDDEDYCSDGSSEFVYNPFKVSINFQECSPQFPLRCAYGHFTGKHGKVPVGTTAVYQDPHVQLDGLYSIVGKYMSIVSDLDALLGCGRIEQVTFNNVDRDIVVAFQENEEYDRTQFTRYFESLVFHEEVGVHRTSDGTPCVVQYMKVTAPTVEEANRLAETAQNMSCSMYGDNACMQQLAICGNNVDPDGSAGTPMTPEGSASTPVTPDGTLMPTDDTTSTTVGATTATDSTTTAPFSTESTPSTTESTPSTTESTPSTTESTPSTTESTPSTTESTPSTTESTPSTTESTPSTTESTPSTTESTPSTTESTPSTTESTPSTTESTPSTTESTPSTTESTPSTTESTPSTTESTPSTTKSTPSTTESSPMSTDASNPTSDGITSGTTMIADTDSTTRSASIAITPLSFTLSVLLTVIIARVIV